MRFPQALFINMDNYLQGLFSLADDPAPEVRKLVIFLTHPLEVKKSKDACKSPNLLLNNHFSGCDVMTELILCSVAGVCCFG